jgi:NADPH:quinone reductase-like Zn-dependent oxidoreductase
MRALVVDPSADLGIRFADVGEPPARSDQVLVDVRHVSLNRGDLNDARSGRLPVGAVLGADVAGIVVDPAANGRGAPTGGRVVGLASGAFATRAVVDLDAMTGVPEHVDLATAAALPVAGVAALQSLRAGGLARDMTVLITGASGGVGPIAVQLAKLAGARVIAAVGGTSNADQLRRLGAADVVTSLDEVDRPVDLVLDTVGGPMLVAAWDLLAPGGSLQSVGWASGTAATFAPYSTVGPPKSLTSFLIGAGVAADLGELVDLLASGTLEVSLGWRGSWDEYAAAAQALLDRRVFGKAVLDVS